MEEKQKPSLIERRLYARILQIMEDKKPYRVKHLIQEFSKCLTQEPKELYKKAGFTSRTSFYRQFKEVTGNTPIEYFANLYYDNVNHSTK